MIAELFANARTHGSQTTGFYAPGINRVVSRSRGPDRDPKLQKWSLGHLQNDDEVQVVRNAVKIPGDFQTRCIPVRFWSRSHLWNYRRWLCIAANNWKSPNGRPAANL